MKRTIPVSFQIHDIQSIQPNRYYSFHSVEELVLEHGFGFWKLICSEKRKKDEAYSASLHFLLNYMELGSVYSKEEVLEIRQYLNSEPKFQNQIIILESDFAWQNFFLLKNAIQSNTIVNYSNSSKIELDEDCPINQLYCIELPKSVKSKGFIHLSMNLNQIKGFKSKWTLLQQHSNFKQSIIGLQLVNSSNVHLQEVLEGLDQLKTLEIISYSNQPIYDFSQFNQLVEFTWRQERGKGIVRINCPANLKQIQIISKNKFVDCHFPFGLNPGCKIRTHSNDFLTMKGQ